MAASSNIKQKAYLQMHLAVFLFGFTAILGKLITLEQTALVWNRLWIAVVGLIFIPGVIKGIRAIDRKSLLRFIGIGVIVSLHWLTFYGCIKIGDNASIALACMSTAAFFVSLLEPLITKSKFQPVELLLGLMVVVGIYILTGVGKDYYLAIVVGLISAFLAALFSVLNKKYIANQNSLSVSTIELFAGFLFISITLPLSNKYLPQPQWIPAGDDWIYLLVLGLLCTSLAFALSIESLKELSAFVATLSVNLEPVYGIILAVLILKEGEELNTPFYVGTAIILLSVVLHPILVKVKKRRQKITS